MEHADEAVRERRPGGAAPHQSVAFCGLARAARRPTRVARPGVELAARRPWPADPHRLRLGAPDAGQRPTSSAGFAARGWWPATAWQSSSPRQPREAAGAVGARPRSLGCARATGSTGWKPRAPRASARGRPSGVCQRRGVFRLGPWDVEMGDPLRLLPRHPPPPRGLDHHGLPRASRLPDLDLPRGRAAGRANLVGRAVEETILVGGLREYAPGDPLRRIHWKASARHDSFMVREFDREPSGDLWLILDMDAGVQAGAEAEATQEYAVILAASLAAQYLRQGERAGRRAAGLGQTAPSAAARPRAGPAVAHPRGAGAGGTGAGSRAGRSAAAVGLEPGQRAHAGGHHALAGHGVGRAAPAPDRPRQCAERSAARRDHVRPAQRGPGALLGLRALLAGQRIPNVTIEQGFPFVARGQAQAAHDGVAHAVGLRPGDPGRSRRGGLTSVRRTTTSASPKARTGSSRLWRRYRPPTGWGVFLLALWPR